MKIAFRKVIGIAILFFTFKTAFSQTGFGITAGTSFFIYTSTPVVIDGMSITPSIDYTITGANTLLRNTTLTHPSINRSINRVFQWNSNLNGYSGNITIVYNDSELNGLAEADLTLNIHDNTTIWQAYTTGVSRNSLSNIVSTNVTNVNLNELTLASVAAPLPLRWGQVMAHRKGALYGLITWNTYEEIGTAFFEVERSTDGVHWSRAGALVTAHNATGEQRYELSDEKLTPAKTYYRIKQVDSDGSFSYSPIVTVAAVAGQTGVTVYPNPAYHQITISTAGAEMQSMKLYNSQGQVAVQSAITSGYSHILNIQALPSGVYRLQVYLADGTTSTSSFIKY